MASPPSPTSTEKEFQAAVNEWVTNSKCLRMVFFGKTGTGKSSLINTLFGKQVAKEGSSIRSRTNAVKCYTETITVIVDDVSVTLWDTPGLKDPRTDGKKTIEEIQDKCIPNVDLFVYCTNINQIKLGQDDVDCIRDITKAFGADIWKRAVFALTFANRPTIPGSSQVTTLEEYCLSREREWGKGFRKVVKNNVNPKDLPVVKINSIPVVATGYTGEPVPGKREWFNDFWIACLSQITFNSMPSFIRTAGKHVDRYITGRVLGQRLAEIADCYEVRPVQHDGGEEVNMTGREIGYQLCQLARKIDDERKKESGDESTATIEMDPSQMMDYLEEGFRIDRSKKSGAAQPSEAVEQDPRSPGRDQEDGPSTGPDSHEANDQGDDSSQPSEVVEQDQGDDSSHTHGDDSSWGAKLLVAIAVVVIGIGFVVFRNK